MDEWAVALILIGVSVLVTAGLIGMCRMLGGWTFLFAFITGNKEERTQLATHEEFGSNGYIVRKYSFVVFFIYLLFLLFIYFLFIFTVKTTISKNEPGPCIVIHVNDCRKLYT